MTGNTRIFYRLALCEKYPQHNCSSATGGDDQLIKPDIEYCVHRRQRYCGSTRTIFARFLLIPYTVDGSMIVYCGVFSLVVGPKTAILDGQNIFLIFRLSPNSKRETTNSYSSPKQKRDFSRQLLIVKRPSNTHR
jgi:hypothetical protein